MDFPLFLSHPTEPNLYLLSIIKSKKLFIQTAFAFLSKPQSRKRQILAALRTKGLSLWRTRSKVAGVTGTANPWIPKSGEVFRSLHGILSTHPLTGCSIGITCLSTGTSSSLGKFVELVQTPSFCWVLSTYSMALCGFTCLHLTLLISFCLCGDLEEYALGLRACFCILQESCMPSTTLKHLLERELLSIMISPSFLEFISQIFYLSLRWLWDSDLNIYQNEC